MPRTNNNCALIGCVRRVFGHEKHRLHVIGLFVQRIDQHRVHASDGGHVRQDQLVGQNSSERASKICTNSTHTLHYPYAVNRTRVYDLPYLLFRYIGLFRINVDARLVTSRAGNRATAKDTTIKTRPITVKIKTKS